MLRARAEYLNPEGGANCSPGCLSDAFVARCGRVRLKGKPAGPRTEPRVQFPLALPKSHDLRPVWLRARALQAGGAVVGPLRSGERRRGSRSCVGVGLSPPGKREPSDCDFPGAPRSSRALFCQMLLPPSLLFRVRRARFKYFFHVFSYQGPSPTSKSNSNPSRSSRSTALSSSKLHLLWQSGSP